MESFYVVLSDGEKKYIPESEFAKLFKVISYGIPGVSYIGRESYINNKQ